MYLPHITITDLLDNQWIAGYFKFGNFENEQQLEEMLSIAQEHCPIVDRSGFSGMVAFWGAESDAVLGCLKIEEIFRAQFPNALIQIGLVQGASQQPRAQGDQFEFQRKVADSVNEAEKRAHILREFR